MLILSFTPFSDQLCLIEVALLNNCCWFCFSLTFNAIRLSKVSGKIWKLINTTFNSGCNFVNKMLQQCFSVIGEICVFKFFKYEINACILCWGPCLVFWCNCAWWSWWFIRFSIRLSRNCLKSLKIIFFIDSGSLNSSSLLYHIFQDSSLRYCIAK